MPVDRAAPRNWDRRLRSNVYKGARGSFGGLAGREVCWESGTGEGRGTGVAFVGRDKEN